MTETSHPALDLTTASDRRSHARAPFRKARRARERVRLLGQTVDLVRPEEVLHHVQN